MTVAGVAVAGYNGTFTVTAVPATNRFSYELAVVRPARLRRRDRDLHRARDRLAAFFADGGGYIGTSVSGTNFTFLTNGGLTAGTFTQGSAERRRRHRPLEQHRRRRQPGHRGLPGDGLLVPPVQRHVLLGAPDRGRRRRPLSERSQRQPDRPDRAVRGRPVARARLGRLGRGGRRPGRRPRQHRRPAAATSASPPTRSRGATSSGPGRSSRPRHCGPTSPTSRNRRAPSAASSDEPAADAGSSVCPGETSMTKAPRRLAPRRLLLAGCVRPDARRAVAVRLASAPCVGQPGAAPSAHRARPADPSAVASPSDGPPLDRRATAVADAVPASRRRRPTPDADPSPADQRVPAVLDRARGRIR